MLVLTELYGYQRLLWKTTEGVDIRLPLNPKTAVFFWYHLQISPEMRIPQLLDSGYEVQDSRVPSSA